MIGDVENISPGRPSTSNASPNQAHLAVLASIGQFTPRSKEPEFKRKTNENRVQMTKIHLDFPKRRTHVRPEKVFEPVAPNIEKFEIIEGKRQKLLVINY